MVEAADAYVGAVLDSRYRLTGVLRSGTTATSYLALRIVDNSPLVVKVLSTHDPTEKELQRLRSEAAVGARLSHPGIATPIAVLRTTDGAPFLVYEPPRGEELSVRLRRVGQLTVEEAIEMVQQAGAALAAAHGAGVIHGDLRPGSIYLDGEGSALRAQLIDFGIARLRESHFKPGPSDSSNTPAVIGAVSYMAPEQAVGQPSDSMTDQFAFGALLYEALTGKPPFGTGSSLAILSRVMHAEPPPAGISREVERVVLRALSKKAADRFPSMEAFVEAFALGCGRRPSLPTRPAATTQKSRTATQLQYGGVPIAPVPRRRRPALVWSLVGGALLVTLAAGVLLGRHFSPSSTAIVATQVAVVDTPPPRPAPPDPSTVALDIDVTPAIARVRINDRQVSLPTVRVPRSATPLTLAVDADGYLPKSVELTPDGDQKVVVRLVSTAAPTLPDDPPRARPRPPAATPQRPPAGGPINDLRDPFSD